MKSEDNMELDTYKIEVLHFLNPHTIWVEVLQTSSQSSKKFAFEQIGIYGILPLGNELRICDEAIESQICTQWDLGANKILEQFFADAVEMQFKPIFVDTRNSIFETKCHKYGDITIRWRDGKIKSLTKILQNSNYATFDENHFNSELLSGNLEMKLNTQQTQNILSTLEKSSILKRKLRNSKDSPTTTSLPDEDQYEQSHNQYQLTEKNLELHNLQMEGPHISKQVPYYVNDNEASNMAFSKPNYSYEEEINSTRKRMSFKEDTHVVSSSKRLQRTKEKLFKMIEKCTVSHINKQPQNLISNNDVARQQTQLKTEFLKKLPLNISGVENEVFESEIKEINVRDTIQTSTPDVKCKKKNNIPKYDKRTTKCVASGPPECLQKLKIQIVPKNSENCTTGVSVPTVERDLKSLSKERHYNEAEDCSQIQYGDLEKNTPLDPVKLYSISNQALNKCNYVKKLTCQMPTVVKINSNEVSRQISDTQVPSERFMNSSVESDNLDSSLNSSSSQLIARKLKFLRLERTRKSSVSNDISSKDISSTSKEDKTLQTYDSNSRDSENETTLSSITEETGQSEKCLSLLQALQKVKAKNKKISVHDVVVANYLKETNVNPLKNIDSGLSKFVDKLLSPSLMVHTKNNNRIIPHLEMRNINFVPNIHGVLRNLCIKRPMMLQTVSWFTILRGHSLFMISPSGSGKTLGYLPAVSNLVIHHYEDADRFGPVCIIVCATARAVADAANLCKKFVGNSKIVLSYYSGVNEEQFLAQLLNGCDILVSTIPALIRLINVADSGLNLQRLSILVMDDCETLSQIHEKELKSLIFKVKKLLQTRVNNIEKIQIVVASTIWCDFMEPFAKWAPDTVVCMGSHLECVLYSKVPTSVDFVHKDRKIDIARQFMKNIDTTKKTVIVCQTNEEVALIENRLKQDKLIVFAADNSMTVEVLYNLSEEWRDYSDPVLGPVLVCCDENLLHLNITDAHNLLHYSLPELYSTFTKRFSVLADSYPSIFKNSGSNSNAIKILLDEQNIGQLPKLLQFVKRCSKGTPLNLDQMASNAIIEKDYAKAHRLVPLCEYLLSLGQCPDFWNCKCRHTVFKEHDEPPQWMPRHSFITFQVISVNSAAMYSVRLLSQITNGKVKKYPQNYSSLAMKMAMYYSNEDNRRPHGTPKIGDICAVAVKINLYQRCQVIEILTFNDKQNPELLLLKLIDEEKWLKAKTAHLYYLPEELNNVPSYVVQVRLANIQPKDKDVTYSYIADDLVRKILENDENFYMKAEIVLAIGTTLIVDKLEVCQDLVFANQSVVRYDIKKELLQGHALINDEHVRKLLEIAEKAGLLPHNKDVLVQESIPIPGDKEILKPCWAHLNKDDFSLVYFASANNLSQIFVRLVKFQNCLDSLSKDIQKYITNNKLETPTAFTIGEIILAEFPDDGLYYRARIEKELNKTKYRCFFVDHGDWREISSSCIYPITKEFVTRMPFQAIECRLVGIKPIGEEWTEFSINWFCDQCFMDKSDKLKTLYVKQFTKEVAEFTEGHKYGIIVIDTTGPKDIVINQSILDVNLAEPVDHESNYITKLNFQRPADDSSSSDDSNWEKDAEFYKDVHYKRKFEDSENTIKSPLDDIFPKNPIRSVPLVASDDESSTGDGFDVFFTKEDIKMLFNQTSKITPKQQLLPPTMDSPKRETAPQVLSESKTLSNKQTIPEHPKTLSSLESSFEIVSSAVKSELDSDDYSTAESVPTNLEENVKEVKHKPKIYWTQTASMVSIRVEIIGVKNYEIAIKERTIKFSTITNNIQYAFDIELYGTIKPNMTKHEAKGLYVLVKLCKLVPRTSWLTLTRDDQMKKWISYDPNSIDISDDDDDGNLSMDKEPFENNIKNTYYAESDRDSDEDSFDDTPEKYKQDSD